MPSKCTQSEFPLLSCIDLHVIENSFVTLLIGNDCDVAHRCLKIRFSPYPEASADAILTPFGWTLKGLLLISTQVKESALNFLIRGLKWPSDV